MAMAYNTEDFEGLKEDGVNQKNILIEGDSWVSHPLVRNYSHQFDKLSNDTIDFLNISVPGDTMLNIMDRHGKQIEILTDLTSSHNFSYKWDAIFLSAMGNDIIGPEIRYFVHKKSDYPNKYGRELLNDFFDLVLNEIKSDYEHFIDIVRGSNKNSDTPIITHSYCYLRPRAVGTHLFGHMFNKGWIHVYLNDKGITGIDEQIDLVKGLLTKCYEVIGSINDPKFLMIDTRELLSSNGTPNVEYFYDEIHPKSKGFAIVAQKIIDEAKGKSFWP